MPWARGAGVAVLAVLPLLLAACQKPPTESAAPPSGGSAKGEKPVVALVIKTLNNPFFTPMREAAQKTAEQQGVQLQVEAPPNETDYEQQHNLIQNVIAQKASAILIAPADSVGVVPVLVSAQKAGIPVINIDNRVDAKTAQAAGLKLAGYVGADNREGGRLAGETLVKLLGGKGQVAILEGIPGADNAEMRKAGAQDAFKAAPGIKVVDSKTAHWQTAEAETVFADMLQANPSIQGVFAANDMMALGAIQAIAAAGKTGKVRVVGYDNLKEAQDAIREGKMDATIEQHPDLMGKEGVALAKAILDGKRPTKTEVLVPLEVITKAKLAAK
ncbi:MAG TPA: substrate-binding domain-containing protein [Armatimonadota bacterium]|jgi:ribose transport system substrate-binding protein